MPTAREGGFSALPGLHRVPEVRRRLAGFVFIGSAQRIAFRFSIALGAARPCPRAPPRAWNLLYPWCCRKGVRRGRNTRGPVQPAVHPDLAGPSNDVSYDDHRHWHPPDRAVRPVVGDHGGAAPAHRANESVAGTVGRIAGCAGQIFPHRRREHPGPKRSRRAARPARFGREKGVSPHAIARLTT